jgi:hypothetical protein
LTEDFKEWFGKRMTELPDPDVDMGQENRFSQDPSIKQSESLYKAEDRDAEEKMKEFYLYQLLNLYFYVVLDNVKSLFNLERTKMTL